VMLGVAVTLVTYFWRNRYIGRRSR